LILACEEALDELPFEEILNLASEDGLNLAGDEALEVLACEDTLNLISLFKRGWITKRVIGPKRARLRGCTGSSL